MTVINKTDTREDRAQGIKNALASVALEGLEPSPEATTIFKRYVDGELSETEMNAAISAMHDEKYGPIRLP